VRLRAGLAPSPRPHDVAYRKLEDEVGEIVRLRLAHEVHKVLDALG
jgi:hypothetical protein